ncbi:MAG: hypothetical protein L6W00_17095 [Lentisphaeria bacterium]|nr:MAG: hypothetical protein L6W00_17095 [Lentisphaeria bacterium]
MSLSVLNWIPGELSNLCGSAVWSLLRRPPARETLFVCRLRDFVGNPLQLEARDFSAVQHRKDAGNFSLVFSDCAALPGTEVEIEARCDGAEIRWRIAVSPGREDFKVEWIDFPGFACVVSPTGTTCSRSRRDAGS